MRPAVGLARALARASAAVLPALGVPRSAAACTWCISSAFGDRSFTWPSLSLALAPFAIGAVIAIVLARSARVDPRVVTARRGAVGDDPDTIKETL